MQTYNHSNVKVQAVLIYYRDMTQCVQFRFVSWGGNVHPSQPI